jgi:hypothetical protein
MFTPRNPISQATAKRATPTCDDIAARHEKFFSAGHCSAFTTIEKGLAMIDGSVPKIEG